MSTNPRATMVYMTPASRPPIRTSKKNAMSASARETSDVRLDHGQIGADRLGRRVRDLPAVVEDDHVVGKVHHHSEIVFDEHEGRSECFVSVDHEPAHVALFVERHSGHWLVEQEQLWLGGERAGQLDALLPP